MSLVLFCLLWLGQGPVSWWWASIIACLPGNPGHHWHKVLSLVIILTRFQPPSSRCRIDRCWINLQHSPNQHTRPLLSPYHLIKSEYFGFTRCYSLIVHRLRNCCSRTCPKRPLRLVLPLFSLSVHCFSKRFSKAVSKKISHPEAPCSVCFPVKWFLSHKRNNCVRRALWSQKDRDSLLHPVWCCWTGCPATCSPLPNPDSHFRDQGWVHFFIHSSN